jgi:GAF domain-containing protein
MDHPLLKRQLKKIGIGDQSAAPDGDMWRQFLERVSRTYTEVDEDRYTLERSLAISSGEMQQMNESLAGEKRVIEMIADGAALPEVLDALSRTIEEQAGEVICSILLLDTGRTLVQGAAPSLPEEYNRAIDGIAIGPNVGSCGTAAYRKEAVVVSDIASDPLWADFRDLALSHGLRACWSTPIRSTSGEVLGTFAMYYGELREPTARDRGLVERATHIAGIAIERGRAQEALSKLSSAVEQSSDSMFITDRHGVIEYVNKEREERREREREGNNSTACLRRIHEHEEE